MTDNYLEIAAQKSPPEIAATEKAYAEDWASTMTRLGVEPKEPNDCSGILVYTPAADAPSYSVLEILNAVLDRLEIAER